MNPSTLTRQLNSVPVAEMVESIARGIAEAQAQMDLLGLRAAQIMAGQYDGRDYRVLFDGERLSLLELGFMPSFYQFTEALIEVKVSISTTEETSTTRSETTTRTESTTEVQRHGFLGLGGSTRKTTSNTTAVSAQFAARYQYSVEGSSFIRTRLVPTPLPAALEQKMRELAATGETG